MTNPHNMTETVNLANWSSSQVELKWLQKKDIMQFNLYSLMTLYLRHMNVRTQCVYCEQVLFSQRS